MTLADGSPLKSVRAVALDLDGVVYEGSAAIPGAVEAVARLRSMGLRVVFMTNNSTGRRRDIAAKLNGLGIPACDEEVYTSAFAAGILLTDLRAGKPARVLVVVDRPPCDFLVVGLDHAFNYDKLSLAIDALRQGAVFVACNRDAWYPVGNGRRLPGCGAIVAAVEAASEHPVDHEIGKPRTFLLRLIAAKNHLQPGEILVVGDVPGSDIVMANLYGAPSVLVDAENRFGQLAGQPECQPTLILRSLQSLPQALPPP
jgi:4-nitrophenyl phosphatase